MPEPFESLCRTLARLPGLGRRSAERAALALVRRRDGLSEALEAALRDAREGVRLCSLCGALTTRERDPCRLCADPARDSTRLCVVEEPGDVLAMERSGAFQGRYHALLGRLSAANATGPAELRVKELVRRVDEEGVQEVMLAISTDVEGDATAAYIAEVLRETPVAVTRLAFGLPADSGVGYSDPLTLKRAVGGRQRV